MKDPNRSKRVHQAPPAEKCGDGAAIPPGQDRKVTPVEARFRARPFDWLDALMEKGFHFAIAAGYGKDPKYAISISNCGHPGVGTDEPEVWLNGTGNDVWEAIADARKQCRVTLR